MTFNLDVEVTVFSQSLKPFQRSAFTCTKHTVFWCLGFNILNEFLLCGFSSATCSPLMELMNTYGWLFYAYICFRWTFFWLYIVYERYIACFNTYWLKSIKYYPSGQKWLAVIGINRLTLWGGHHYVNHARLRWMSAIWPCWRQISGWLAYLHLLFFILLLIRTVLLRRKWNGKMI